MKKAWYIDSIEPWGGRVFATYRIPDLDSSDLNEAISYFMAPPAFEAELVADRSIAMSAERAGFQTGLYLEGREVSFPSLDAIREFVRRTFVANGPDATPTAAAGNTEPPRDKGGEGQVLTPDKQPPPGQGPQRTLLDVIEDFQKASSQLKVGESVPWHAELRPTSPSERQASPSDVQRSAHALLLQLARASWWCLVDCYDRAPKPGDSSWLSWTAEARAFCRAIDRLDLWDALTRFIVLHNLHPELPSNLKQMWSQSQNSEGNARSVIFWAQYQAAMGDRSNISDFNTKKYLDWATRYYRTQDVTTPYETLSLLRCPIPCQELNITADGSIPSMRALLMRLTSAPALTLKALPHRRDQMVSLIVFAAAQMASPSIAQAVPPPRLVSGESPTYSPMLLSALTTALWGWFERAFPRYVFAPAVEALIANGLEKPTLESTPTPATPIVQSIEQAPQRRQERSAGA